MFNLKYMFKTFSDIDDPPRGGVRGGQDQFSWEQVKLDRDRENYLGHSVKAPVGRSQGGPDFLWYTKEKKAKKADKASVSDERKRVIELERQAMAKFLGPVSTVGQKPILTPSHPLIFTPSKPDSKLKVDEKMVKSKSKKVEKSKKNKHSRKERSREITPESKHRSSKKHQDDTKSKYSSRKYEKSPKRKHHHTSSHRVR